MPSVVTVYPERVVQVKKEPIAKRRKVGHNADLSAVEPGPKGKENPCVCNSSECSKWRSIFTKNKHPDFCGRCVEVKLSSSCNALNFISSACRNLHVPASKRNAIMEEARSTGDSSAIARTRATHSEGGYLRRGRIAITPHHFKLGIFDMKRIVSSWSWVQPVKIEDIQRFSCLADKFRDGAAVRYNTSLSDKLSNGLLKRDDSSGSEVMCFVKATCATKEEVLSVVNGYSTQLRQPVNRHREMARTTEEWLEYSMSQSSEI